MSLTRRTLLSASVLTLLVGCASVPEPPSTPRFAPPTPALQETPRASIPRVPAPTQRQRAIEALTTMNTWHTATDATQTAADLRARTYFTNELAATITAPDRNGASGEWFAHPHSTTRPKVIAVKGTDSNHPGLLSYEVSWEWVDAAGSSTPGESVRLYSLAMTNTPEGWKISDYTYEEYPRHSQ